MTAERVAKLIRREDGEKTSEKCLSGAWREHMHHGEEFMRDEQSFAQCCGTIIVKAPSQGLNTRHPTSSHWQGTGSLGRAVWPTCPLWMNCPRGCRPSERRIRCQCP